MIQPSVEIQQHDGQLIAEFWDCHRLDPAPVGELRRAVEAHLAQGGKPALIVNLLGVGFAGSTALSGFTAIHRALKARGGALVFAHVEPNLREVFRVSRLEPLFRFADDVPGALQLLSEPRTTPRRAEAPPAASHPAPLRRRRAP